MRNKGKSVNGEGVIDCILKAEDYFAEHCHGFSWQNLGSHISRVEVRRDLNEFAPTIEEHFANVMVLGFDVFESGLANVALLGIYHGLGVLMQFKRCFCEHARFVEKLLNKCPLHGGMTAPYSFGSVEDKGMSVVWPDLAATDP